MSEYCSAKALEVIYSWIFA